MSAEPTAAPTEVAAAVAPADAPASAPATDAPSEEQRLCENCEADPIAFYCAECKMEFCERCDADFHRPVKKSTHVRKVRFPTAIADILRRCEKEGKVSDYGASKPEGKDVLKYVLEYEDGYYYLFKNNSSDVHLDTELEFKMENLDIVGFEGESRVRVSLPPSSLQYIHLHRKDSKLACKCEVLQRFALTPPKPGKLPSVYVPVVYTADTPVEVLMAQTEKEGHCTDHGNADASGQMIHQWQWDWGGGYCYLWRNSSKDTILHKEIEMELTNLRIRGKEEGTKKYVVDLKPGESDFLILEEVEAKQGYKMSMRAGFSLQKVKA